MKRFFDTAIWRKEWFMDLSPNEKSAWFYIISECDNVGVWSPNFKLAEFTISGGVDWESFAKKLNGNVKILPNGKWWFVDFCAFQHPDLSDDSTSNAIRSYVSLLKKHGLWGKYQQLGNSTPTVHDTSRDRDREQDRDREEEEGQRKAEIAAVIEYLNESTGSRFKAKTEASAKYVSGRLSDGYTVEDLKSVVDHKSGQWLGDEKMSRFLRPATLFAPEKFAGYLAEADRTKVSAVPENTYSPRGFVSGT